MTTDSQPDGHSAACFTTGLLRRAGSESLTQRGGDSQGKPATTQSPRQGRAQGQRGRRVGLDWRKGRKAWLCKVGHWGLLSSGQTPPAHPSPTSHLIGETRVPDPSSITPLVVIHLRGSGWSRQWLWAGELRGPVAVECGVEQGLLFPVKVPRLRALGFRSREATGLATPGCHMLL